jgi:hypothetical protein
VFLTAKHISLIRYQMDIEYDHFVLMCSVASCTKEHKIRNLISQEAGCG